MRLKPRDWLLLLLDGGLDPIRIQKAMFLFAMESGAPDTEVYRFEPYNWGPFSSRIYGDLERLQTDGMAVKVPVPGAGYAQYRRTAAGNVEADRLSPLGDSAQLACILKTRDAVTGMTFDNLLRKVYKDYPEYATKTMFPEFATKKSPAH
jgi:uncharacterized protein YwgA